MIYVFLEIIFFDTAPPRKKSSSFVIHSQTIIKYVKPATFTHLLVLCLLITQYLSLFPILKWLDHIEKFNKKIKKLMLMEIIKFG